MGMDKSGTQTLPAGVWTKLVSFTVRSGYPSTNITNNTLVMDTTGSGDLRFRGGFVSTAFTQQFRVVKNGTTVVGSAANTGVTTTIAGQSIVPGDTFELQGFASQGGGFSDVAGGAANTFLEYNQVTSTQSVAGTTSEVWGRSGTLVAEEVVSGT